MVDSSDKTGLTVIFILYMLILIASGLWGWWKQRKRIQGSKEMENAEEELASQ